MSESEGYWEEMSERWRSESVAGSPGTEAENDAPFLRTLRRRRFVTTSVVMGEVVVTATLVYLTALILSRPPTGVDRMFLVGLWILWAVATFFAWWNRRGTWSRSASDSRTFLSLSVEHARSKVRVAWFSAVLLVAQLALAVSSWAWGDGFMRDGFPSLVVLVAWLVPVAVLYAGWIVWYHRRGSAEARHFGRLLAETDREARTFEHGP